MKKGMTAVVKCPSSMAFGILGNGDAIKSNADLLLEITVVDFQIKDGDNTHQDRQFFYPSFASEVSHVDPEEKQSYSHQREEISDLILNQFEGGDLDFRVFRPLSDQTYSERVTSLRSGGHFETDEDLWQKAGVRTCKIEPQKDEKLDESKEIYKLLKPMSPITEPFSVRMKKFG